MSIIDASKKRSTAKIYDKNKKLTAAQINDIAELLKNTPSSVNSQPWHFFFLESQESRDKVLPAVSEFNHPRVQDAALTVVFCIKETLDDAHLSRVVDEEELDGRFATKEMKEMNDQGRRYFTGLNSETKEKLHLWERSQVYIALGTLLLGASALDIDATAIEGFDPAEMDKILGLKEKGLKSVVIASLGFSSDEDFNAKLPKSRLEAEEIITKL